MLSAAILAGGQATRFGGRDKGTLVVDGRPIRERQLAELAPFAGDILIVGSSASVRQGAGADHSRVRLVNDRVPGCGPLGGLHTALAEAKSEPVVVIACDMPYVLAPLLQVLATLAADADAIVPQTERGYHLLCAAYTRPCLEPAARRLTDRRLKLIDLLEDVQVRIVPAEELRKFGDTWRLLANVNSPADHRELEAVHGRQSQS